jgi:hypothetical protein
MQEKLKGGKLPEPLPELDATCQNSALGLCCISRICTWIQQRLSGHLASSVSGVLNEDWKLDIKDPFVFFATPIDVKPAANISTALALMKKLHADSKQYGGVVLNPKLNIGLLFMHVLMSPISALFAYALISDPKRSKRPRAMFNADGKITANANQEGSTVSLPPDLAAVIPICNAEFANLDIKKFQNENPLCKFFTQYTSENETTAARKAGAQARSETFQAKLTKLCDLEIERMSKYVSAQTNDATLQDTLSRQTSPNGKQKLALLALTLFAITARKEYELSIDAKSLLAKKGDSTFNHKVHLRPSYLAIAISPNETRESIGTRISEATGACIDALSNNNAIVKRAADTISVVKRAANAMSSNVAVEKAEDKHVTTVTEPETEEARAAREHAQQLYDIERAAARQQEEVAEARRQEVHKAATQAQVAEMLNKFERAQSAEWEFGLTRPRRRRHSAGMHV